MNRDMNDWRPSEGRLASVATTVPSCLVSYFVDPALTAALLRRCSIVFRGCGMFC
jgi:hypothetical protein